MTELPLGWVSSTLDQIAFWGSGGTPSRRNPEFFVGNIPWIKTGELGPKYVRSAEEHISEAAIEASSAKVFPKGAVGIAMYGATIGKTSIWAIDAASNQACAVAQCYPGVFNEFLYYFLISQQSAFVNAGKGGAQPNISQTVIKDWPIDLPPTGEQHRIVAKLEELLSELDKGVDALTIARSQLSAYRESILKSAFSGELSLHWRRENRSKLKTGKQILAFLEDARAKAAAKHGRARSKSPVPYDTTDVSNYPADWALVSVDALCHHITSGSRDWSQFYDRGTSVFVMAQNVRPGYYDASVIQYVDPPQENAETERTQIQKNDILVTIVGANTGDVCLFPLEADDHYVCQSVALIRLSHVEYAKFMELYFQSQAGGKGQYARYIYGAGRPHLSFEQIKQTVVPIPDPAEATFIVSKIDAVFTQIARAEATLKDEVTRAGSLRLAVLKAALSGKLTKQDEKEEPASVLLERIGAELAKTKRRKQKNSKTGRKKAA